MIQQLTRSLRRWYEFVFFMTHPVHGDPGDTYWQAWCKYRIHRAEALWLATHLTGGFDR